MSAIIYGSDAASSASSAKYRDMTVKSGINYLLINIIDITKLPALSSDVVADNAHTHILMKIIRRLSLYCPPERRFCFPVADDGRRRRAWPPPINAILRACFRLWI